jgi:hypothetical protein
MMTSDDVVLAKRNYITETERSIARNAIEAVKAAERMRSNRFNRKLSDDSVQVRLSERRLREAADEDF